MIACEMGFGGDGGDNPNRDLTMPLRVRCRHRASPDIPSPTSGKSFRRRRQYRSSTDAIPEIAFPSASSVSIHILYQEACSMASEVQHSFDLQMDKTTFEMP